MPAIKRAAVFATVRKKGTGGAPIVEKRAAGMPTTFKPRTSMAQSLTCGSKMAGTQATPRQAAGQPSGETTPQLGTAERQKSLWRRAEPLSGKARRGCPLGPVCLPVAGANALAGIAIPAATARAAVEAASGVRAGVAGGHRGPQRSVPSNAAVQIDDAAVVNDVAIVDRDAI